jgi:hypothetical protein
MKDVNIHEKIRPHEITKSLPGDSVFARSRFTHETLSRQQNLALINDLTREQKKGEVWS